MAEAAPATEVAEAVPSEGAEVQEASTPASELQAPSEGTESEGGESSPEATGEAETTPASPDSEPEAPRFEVALGEGKIQVPLQDLIKGYQLSFQAKEDLEEAARYITSAQKIHQGLVKNPLGTLFEALRDQYGEDPHAEEYARQQLVAIVDEFKSKQTEYESLPEETKQLRALQRQNAKLQAERDEWRKEKDTQEKQSKKAEAVNRTLGEISSALKAGGLSDSEIYQRQVAMELLDARKGNEEITAADAVKRVKQRLATELEEKLKGLDGVDPKTMQELFPNLIQKLRQADVAEVKNLRSQRLPPRTNGVKPPAKQEVTILRDGDWDNIFGTK